MRVIFFLWVERYTVSFFLSQQFQLYLSTAHNTFPTILSINCCGYLTRKDTQGLKTWHLQKKRPTITLSLEGSHVDVGGKNNINPT